MHDHPSLERTILLCGTCSEATGGGKLGEPSRWRCLETVVWSELPALQVTSIRLLRRLADDGVDWASGTLESVYPSEETEAWLSE